MCCASEPRRESQADRSDVRFIRHREGLYLSLLQHFSLKIGNTCLSCSPYDPLYLIMRTGYLAGQTSRGNRWKQQCFSHMPFGDALLLCPLFPCLSSPGYGSSVAYE